MSQVSIKNYEGLYEVSSDGGIYNIKRKKYLKNVLADRYYIVLLYKKNKRKRHYVHRLVADAFCEKQEGKEYVNHKDLDRSNNDYSNLEWVTAKENRIHYIKSDKYKATVLNEEAIIKIKERNYKKVLCLKTNAVFQSMESFAKNRNISIAQVSQKLNGTYTNNLNAILI
jgi:hypothetical protein